MRKMRLLTPLVVLLMLALFTSVQAQEGGITLTLAVPQFMEDIISAELLTQFEAENLGVNVRVVAGGFGIDGEPANNLESYLDGMVEYVSAADVLFADSGLKPEATRAGLFLDLAPLTSSDTSLNVNDFYPAAWSSFQWDNGVWALPVSVNLTTLSYNPEAFDEAGLPYPNEEWTLDDLASAARALTETDATGDITTPGLIVFGEGGAALVRSLLGAGLYDASTLPETPDLTNPALETLLTTWAELEAEGVVARQYEGNFLELPMRIGGGVFRFGGPNEINIADALLPGGTAALDAQGFAVSSGTQYPQQAYALAKFLTNRPEVATSFFGVRPARQSLVGVQADSQGGPAIFLGEASPEQEAFIDSAMAAALPMSELRYAEYLNAALNSITNDGLDAATALQDAENSVIANLETAADQSSTTTVLVATPPPAVVLGEGEISLNFGFTSFIQPLPNEEQWNEVIAEFVASDPQVAEVVLDIPSGGFFGGGGGQDMAEQYDCYYLPYNSVPELDTTTVLNLDPYLDADPTFDRNDVVGNALSQVQQNAMTWALPITLQPQVLNYSPDSFAEAGAIEPESGWTTDEFVNALNALKVITEDDPPFQSQGPGSNYLLMLIAAFGGLPLDYRTDPVTINFTDPATVDAIRQVLDLAKAGLIDYQEQAQGGVIAIAIQGGQAGNLPPITTQSLFGFGDILVENGGSENPYSMTSYPTGTQYSPIIYDITTGYISATSENPDACYRWLSTISRHPELFNGMPARRSLLSDSSVVAALGQDAADFYSQFDAALQSPNAITFPTPFAGAQQTSFILQLWLNRAFDNYVLNDGDLEADLADAQIFATAYQECAASLPPFDPATDGLSAFQQIQECITAADPSMGGLFGGG